MDDDSPTFATAREAWAYLADERQCDEDRFPDDEPIGEYSDTLGYLRYAAGDEVEYGNPHEGWPLAADGSGTIYGPTPGYQGDHDLGIAYTVTALPPSDLDTLRLPEGHLRQYTSIGSYPILYLTRNNDVLCANCATKALNDPDAFDPPVDYGLHEEGGPERCQDCNKEIPSAYGDPNEESDDDD